MDGVHHNCWVVIQTHEQQHDEHELHIEDNAITVFETLIRQNLKQKTVTATIGLNWHDAQGLPHQIAWAEIIRKGDDVDKR